MRLRDLRRWLSRKVLRRHRPARSFDQDATARGGVGASHDLGLKIVPVEKIVGSVGRWQNLRSDFFYRKGDLTERFVRIGRAMLRGVDLPPIEVYKLKRPDASGEAGSSEYYVVDGHHRVAMARELGQDFLDANVKEFEVRETRAESDDAPPTARSQAADTPPSPTASPASPEAPGDTEA